MQDKRIRYYVNPERLLWSSQPENVSNIQATLNEGTDSAKVKVVNEPVSLVYDFGREYHGGIRIRTASIEDVDGTHITHTKVRLRFGESLAEVMGEPNNDHSVHDIEMIMPSHSHFEFGQTGFRFFRLDFTGLNHTVDLIGVSLVALEFPWKQIGQFKCDDEELNRIWDVSVRTVHLCCQEQLWDGIKRDRLAWAGDVHPQLPVLGNVFSLQADPLVRKTLKYMFDRTPEGEWVNCISSYSLWWIISLYDWYIQTGEISLLWEMESRLTALLEMLEEYIDEDGQEKLGEARFLDWASAPTPEKISPGLQALCIWGLRCSVEIYETLKNEDKALKYRKLHDLMKSRPWQAGDLTQNKCLGVYAGLAGAEDIAGTLLDVNRPEMSPWFGGYYLEVLSAGGQMNNALTVLKNYWGGMLKLGATTFWEHFDCSWLDNAVSIDSFREDGQIEVHPTYGDFCYKGLRNSFCHGWAGSPVGWMSRNILGIKPLDPGYKRISISPKLGHLKFASGVVATPSGPIGVQHELMSDGRINTKLDLPEGVEVDDSEDALNSSKKELSVCC